MSDRGVVSPAVKAPTRSSYWKTWRGRSELVGGSSCGGAFGLVQCATRGG
jgi:hypothetical protein